MTGVTEVQKENYDPLAGDDAIDMHDAVRTHRAVRRRGVAAAAIAVAILGSSAGLGRSPAGGFSGSAGGAAGGSSAAWFGSASAGVLGRSSASGPARFPGGAAISWAGDFRRVRTHLTVPFALRAPAGAPEPSVSGRRLVNAHGQGLRLLGVNRPGTHYECVQTTDRIFDGPSGDASVQAIASWHATAVRVTLNEDCWLGINGVSPAVSGAAYRTAIAGYVARLHQYGLAAILTLQWSDGDYTGGTCQQKADPAGAVCQKPMPDAAHAAAFWTSVASTFKNDHAAVFDLFSEPFPDRLMSSRPAAWACWLRGGRFCTGFSYQVAGMQTLLQAVRRAGATNVVAVGGINYANDDSGWRANRPADPAHNLAASWHSYSWNACHTKACWDQQIAPLADGVPLIADEIGEDDCAHSYIDTLMPWLDQRGASYLAWGWKAQSARFPCGDFNHGNAGPSLITSYEGTPTPYGSGLEDHLTACASARGGPADTATARPRGRVSDALESPLPQAWQRPHRQTRLGKITIVPPWRPRPKQEATRTKS